MSPGRRFVLLVGVAVLAGCGLRAAIGLTDDAPTTDETAYLRSGSSLVAGDGFVRGDRPELHFPPLVPFVLGTVGRVVDDAHQATVVMTLVCGTLLIVPLALLGRRVGGEDAGIATAWVAALAPGLATMPAARGAGSEAEYALLVVTAVWLVLAAGDHTGPRRALAAAGAGLLVGLAYLTRPEGLFVAVPLGATLVWTARTGGLRVRQATSVPGGAPAGHARGRRAAAGVAAAFVLPLVACMVPYVAFLHTHTGSWELTAKTRDASIEAWHAVARNDREARDAVLYDLDAAGTDFAAGSAPLAELARDDPGGYLRIVATNVVDHTAQRRAGEWLAAHSDADDRVMTRSFVVDHYAERPTLAIPYADLDEIVAFGRRYGARYLVVDQYTVETLRPQLTPLAGGGTVPGLTAVHEVVAEGRTTRIFAFAPPPARPAARSDDDVPSLAFTGDAST